ncbi:Alpha-ketoglutarate-dependent dioxygenase alkB 7, mitochondrial [Linnemannia zychae]|nr:Alpha-ketoglutarate-dependent dioxygenase alkB 7, mitochondrial [Linnemannia zychae]
MTRTIVGTTLNLCKRAVTNSHFPHRATPLSSLQAPSISNVSYTRSTLATPAYARLLSTAILHNRHPSSLSSKHTLQTPSVSTQFFSTSTETNATSSSSTTKDSDDGSLLRYISLSTSPAIAASNFDLTHIPVEEQAQILQDFILVPEYLSQEEHDMMVKGATLKLKRALGKQVRYEDGHFDGVITRYRECSAGDWSPPPFATPISGTGSDHENAHNSNVDKKERTTPREMMDSIKKEFFPSSWKWVSPHILELEAGQGGIKPHVDHLDASGSVVAGLCLGSSAVMELIHQDDPKKWFRVLLPKRCFYFQRDSVRYSYKHGIPIEQQDHQFRGTNALDSPNHTGQATTMY